MRTVSELLSAKGNSIWSTRPNATVYEALQIMAERNIGALLVLESGKVEGIFSERDYARKVALQGKPALETPVREVMTSKVIGVEQNRTIDECMALMTEKRIRHLPVLDGDRLIGIISIGDVVKEVILDQQFTISLLEEYITGRR